MRKRQILVVGDEQKTGVVFRQVLEDQGYEVTLLNNGFAAMHTLKQKPIFAAFVDPHAPGMNGIESLKQIKSISPYTNVIVITDYTQTEEVDDALRLGCFVCMTEPFELDDVLAVLDVFECGINPLSRAA